MAENGEVEIVGGNNADGSNTNTNIVPIAGRRYEDHPQYPPLLAALKSRSYGGNLTEKKEVLLKFRPSELNDVERYCRDRELWREYGRHLFEIIRIKSTKPSDITQNFKMEFVAECLADLYILNQWIKDLPVLPTRVLRGRDDPLARTKAAFVSLTRYVGPILKKYGEDQAKKSSTKSKVNLQQNGHRVQDTVPFKPSYVDGDECPNPDCRHFE